MSKRGSQTWKIVERGGVLGDRLVLSDGRKIALREGEGRRLRGVADVCMGDQQIVRALMMLREDVIR